MTLFLTISGTASSETHLGVGVDVVLDVADVFDEDRPALERGLADDAAAELDAHALDLRRVADLEAHPQLVGAVVEQQDGEDAVVDDGAHQVRDAVHQRVQVEGGVERVGQPQQEVDLQGLEPGLRRGRHAGRIRRPVVAFEQDLVRVRLRVVLGRSGLRDRRHL